MKYRKKPVVIEAILWDGKAKTLMGFAPYTNVIEPPEIYTDGRLWIPTLEGHMFAEIGDWIIQGVKGEIYPCKPDIFEMTYEGLENEHS